MSTRDRARAAFAERLNQALDAINFERAGRQTALAAQLAVTQKAARKWLVGEGFPTKDKCMQIARLVRRSYEWLMTGNESAVMAMISEPQRDPYRDPREQRVIDVYRNAAPRDKELIERIVDAFSSAS